MPDEQQSIYDPSRMDPVSQIPEGDETIISSWAYLAILKALVMPENSDTKPDPIICQIRLNAANTFETMVPPDINIRRQLEIFLYLKNFTDPTKLSLVSRSDLLTNLTPYLAEFCDRFGQNTLPNGQSYNELLIDDILPADERNILLLRLGRSDNNSTWKQRSALYKLDCSTGTVYERNKFAGYDARVSSNWIQRSQITPYKK